MNELEFDDSFLKPNNLSKSMAARSKDEVMTEDDHAALLAYRKEKAAKKLISHEQLKKELDI